MSYEFPTLFAAEAARELGLSVSRTREIARIRNLGRKLGNWWIFTREEVDAMRVRKPGRPKKS